jgi:NAD(P)-dependent dehydrogenase (short-subunit alcohol dehydrogenase family)
MTTDSIEGMAALVTGGGSGIGLEIATRLAADGADVTICGRTEAKLEEAGGLIGAAAAPGVTVRTVVADITDEAQVAHAVGVAGGDGGRLDLCVANAGGSLHLGSIVDADAAQVQATFDLTLRGTFLTIKHAAASMVASGGGSIVAISSGASHFPHRWLWAYGSAKAGVDMLCQYAAEELADKGVRVNAVQPGLIDTELVSVITGGGALLADYLEQTPLGRVGTAQDVAQAVRYLLGPGAAWVTGELLTVDGGHHLRRGADYSKLFST